MAKDVERLVLELSADVSKLDRGMRQGQAITQRQTRAIERQFDQMNQRTSRSVSDMGANIRNTIAGIALGAAVREVGLYADAWNRMSNPLRAAGLEQEAVNAQMQQLVDIALRSRSSLEGTVTFYNRLTSASSELGLAQKDVLRIVETVNKALATSQLSGAERESAVTQLVQGLGSGNLAGDELKALRENALPLAQAIAKEFGVAVGELKKLGSEGELTSTRVAQALLKASESTDAAFARTQGTISDAFTNLQTRAMAYVASLDQATGASEKFASLVGFVANNLDAFGEAAVVAATVVGGALAGRAMVAAFGAFTALQAQIAVTNAQLVAFEIRAGLATGALGRMTVASAAGAGAMRALSASMAFVGGPIGLAIIAIAAAIYLLSRRTTEAEQTMKDLEAATSRSDRALQNYEKAQIAARDASGKSAAAARDNAAAMRQEAEAAVIAARALAAKATATAQMRLTQASQAYQEAISTEPGREFGEVAGQLALAAAAQKEYTQAQAAAGAVVKESIRQQQELSRITAGVNLGGVGGGGGPVRDTGGGSTRSGSSGPSPEEIARTRQLLELEMALNRLDASGRTYDAEQVQALIDKINLTEQLKAAGVADAEAVASAQIDAVRNAEAAARGREAAAERLQAIIEMTREAEAAMTEEMDRQLQVQIALAQIEGNEAVVRMLERELALRQQIASLGENANPDTVARIRRDEAMLNSAEDRQIALDRGKDMARTFFDVLRAEDIGAEIGNRFREAAFDGLENVLANIFSQLFSQQGGGGGGIGQTVTSAIGSFFGGKRALGGPVKAGQFYKVNENTANSEWFAPGQDGYVGNAPRPRGGPRGTMVTLKQGDIYITGTGDAALRSYVDRAVAISSQQTIAAVKAGAPNAQLEQNLLRD